MRSGEAQLVSKSNPTEGVFLAFVLTLLRRVPPFGLAAVPAAAASICRVSPGTYFDIAVPSAALDLWGRVRESRSSIAHPLVGGVGCGCGFAASAVVRSR
jgi:hypothetical protein